MAESPPETGDAAAASPNRLAGAYKEPEVPVLMGLGIITPFTGSGFSP
jgi:hypothetical protein